MFLRLGRCCRPFWLVGWWVCRSLGELSALIESWIEGSWAWPQIVWDILDEDVEEEEGTDGVKNPPLPEC